MAGKLMQALPAERERHSMQLLWSSRPVVCKPLRMMGHRVYILKIALVHCSTKGLLTWQLLHGFKRLPCLTETLLSLCSFHRSILLPRGLCLQLEGWASSCSSI